MTLERLGELISRFEAEYAGTGAAAKMDLRNPKTGDPSNVELHFVQVGPGVPAAGLYVVIAQGRPQRLDEAPPVIQARAALHLPELGKVLDGIVEIIDQQVAEGIEVLEPWLRSRGNLLL